MFKPAYLYIFVYLVIFLSDKKGKFTNRFRYSAPELDFDFIVLNFFVIQSVIFSQMGSFDF